MANNWRKCLVIFGLAFVFATVGCGEEEPGEDPENQQSEYECEDHPDCVDEESGEDGFCTDHFQTVDEPQCVECMTDDHCDGDAPFCVQGSCDATNACANADDDCFGDTPYCDDNNFCTDIHPDQCQDNSDCQTSGQPNCHNGSCVSDDFICQLQDCGGQRGVCNPAGGADGQCVNADHCEALSECEEEYKCVANSCEPKEEVCGCESDEYCQHYSDTLEVECVVDQICDPGSRECDDDFLVVCSDDGTTEQTPFCTEGCVEDGDGAYCKAPEGETCDAPLMPDGDELTTWEIPWSEYTNNYSPDETTPCFDDESLTSRTAGSDAVFGTELEPGEVGVFELITELDYAVVYMLGNCTTDLDDGCISPDGTIAEDHEDGFMRAAWYENDTDQTQTVYFVADTGTGASGLVGTANLIASEQVCNPGNDVCSGGELGECSTYGTHFVTDSDRACTDDCFTDDPTDALCEPMAHSSCSDAIQYNPDTSATFTGNILDFHADETLSPSSCIDQSVGSGSDDFEGPTAYYTVDLDDNQRLNASLASNFEAGLWFSTSCDAGSCQKAVNQDATAEHAEYIADGDQTINIVVQAVDANVPKGEFTLDLSTDPPLCEGLDSGDVLGCVDGDYIHYCHGTDYPERYACDGECSDGSCVEPTGSQCLDPIILEPGEPETASFADGTDDLTPLTCGGDDEFDDPLGPDFVYQLDLQANDLVDIHFDTISADAGFYLLEDCPVATQNVSAQCILGAIPSGDHREFFTDEAGTYYIVADSSNRFDPAEFTIDVDVNQATCLPDSKRCHNGNVELCADDGSDYNVLTQCAIGCDDTALSCSGPEEANNRCGDDNTYLVDSPGQVNDNFERFTSRQTLDPDEGGCFEDGTSGPDAFYEFELDAESAIRVNATIDIDDGDTHDVGLYITDGCILDGNSCMESASVSGSDVMEQSIEYYSTSGGTYTLGLAGIDDFDSGDFTLDFEFFDGQCDPGQDNFCDADTAIQCSNLGQTMETDCPYGCDDGECLDKKGDVCSRPYNLDADGTDDGNTISLSVEDEIGEFSDVLNPYDDGQSCTGYYGDGPDVIVAFDAWAGDEIAVDFDTNYDGAVWITTDCGSEAADQCIEGVDDVFGPGLEQLSYTFDQQGTYYVVGDAVQNGATGMFDLDISLEKGPREDDPQIEVTDADELSWQLDINESASDTFQIANEGDLDLDFDIVEDIDWLDVSPETGTVEADGSTDIDVTATCGGDDASFTDSFDIESNDPATPTYTVDVTLDCNDPAPVIELTEADELSWVLDINESGDDTFQIANLGDDDLNFDIVEAIDWLDVSPETGSVAGGTSTEVGLTATCGDDDGDFTDSFDVESNDPNQPVVTVDVDLTCNDDGGA